MGKGHLWLKQLFGVKSSRVDVIILHSCPMNQAIHSYQTWPEPDSSRSTLIYSVTKSIASPKSTRRYETETPMAAGWFFSCKLDGIVSFNSCHPFILVHSCRSSTTRSAAFEALKFVQKEKLPRSAGSQMQHLPQHALRKRQLQGNAHMYILTTTPKMYKNGEQ